MANNVAIAYRFLRRKGLTDVQASAVIGVMQGESGKNLDPGAVNPSSGATGIAQWLGPRKNSAVMSKQLGPQLNHLWAELTGPESGSLRKLRSAKTLDQAVNAFLFGFERPGANEANLPLRLSNAKSVLGQHGGSGGGGATTPSDSTSGGTTSTPSTQTLLPGQTTTVPDPAAEKRVLLANLIQRQNPGSLLLKLGVLDPNEPTTKTETTPDQILTTPGTKGSSKASPSVPPMSGAVRGKSPLLELIHKTGNGPGYAVKNGKVVSGPGVYGAVWNGHADHVHVAAGPKTIVQIGKIAQKKFGLHVGENPHFGGVAPVHAKNSYHYRGEAIDVSGDPKQMDRFANYVERYFGIRNG